MGNVHYPWRMRPWPVRGKDGTRVMPWALLAHLARPRLGLTARSSVDLAPGCPTSRRPLPWLSRGT